MIDETEKGASLKRPYYTDPLAAAWMAKHFGMRFDEDIEDMLLFCLLDQRQQRFSYREPTSLSFLVRGKKILLHADGLHLMKPRVGDVVYACPEDMGEGTYWRYMEWEPCNAENADWWSIDRIIQRDGIAFHWPESEAA